MSSEMIWKFLLDYAMKNVQHTRKNVENTNLLFVYLSMFVELLYWALRTWASWAERFFLKKFFCEHQENNFIWEKVKWEIIWFVMKILVFPVFDKTPSSHFFADNLFKWLMLMWHYQVITKKLQIQQQEHNPPSSHENLWQFRKIYFQLHAANLFISSS